MCAHRNEGYWERADEFDPDRFPVDKPVPNETTENFNYLPFGGGKRKCIGAMFCYLASLLVLSDLARQNSSICCTHSPAMPFI